MRVSDHHAAEEFKKKNKSMMQKRKRDNAIQHAIDEMSDEDVDRIMNDAIESGAARIGNFRDGYSNGC